jgi:hypothetical protein
MNPPDLSTAHVRLHGGPYDGKLVHWPYGLYLKLPASIRPDGTMTTPSGQYVADIVKVRDTHTYIGRWDPAS